MGMVIDFIQAYEARRGKKFCPLPPPGVFYCWTCRSVSRYCLVDDIQTCALCHFPKVQLTQSPPMPRLSGAKDPMAPLWLPLEEEPCDREIVAWVCWSILLERGLHYCPTHSPTPDACGLCASEFYVLFKADRPEDRALIDYVLKLLIEKKWVVRFGRGVAGDPFRYYVWQTAYCQVAQRGSEASNEAH